MHRVIEKFDKMLMNLASHATQMKEDNTKLLKKNSVISHDFSDFNAISLDFDATAPLVQAKFTHEKQAKGLIKRHGLATQGVL